jgi:type II secretory pathway predicted ATPase ExeA
MSRYRHFSLTREPFAPTPDLAFQAPTLGQTDALARLREVAAARAGLAIVTGEPGIGKSLVRLALARDLITTPAVRVLTLDHPADWSTDVTFLRAVAAALRTSTTGRTTLELMSEIGQRLAAIVNDDHWPVLLVDDAHRLTGSQLELVRTMIGGEGDPARLSLILFGEPELEERIARKRTLARRLVMRHTLNPINPDDAAGLIAHRLRVAGLADRTAIFDQASLTALITQARGNPRALIGLAAAALDAAASRNAAMVDAATVSRALAAAGETASGDAGRDSRAVGGKR